jgi:hypothetical protein
VWNRDDAAQDMLVCRVFRRKSHGPQYFVQTAKCTRPLTWGGGIETLTAHATFTTASR